MGISRCDAACNGPYLVELQPDLKRQLHCSFTPVGSTIEIVLSPPLEHVCAERE